MNPVASTLVALSLSASSLAFAQDPPAPPPPPPAPPAAPVMAPPPPMMPPPQMMVIEEAPSRGTGLIVTGSVFAGVGVLNLVTSPICLGLGSVRSPCLIASLVIGGTFLAVGVPLLVVGAGKRSAYKEWQARHPGLAGLGFSPGKNAGALTWSAQF